MPDTSRSRSATRRPSAEAPLARNRAEVNHSRRGLIAGGNWVIDHIKVLDTWPEQDALAQVLEHTTGNGGAPYNVLKDLARLQVPYPLEAIGAVGEDDDGRSIRDDCVRHGIAIDQLRQLRGVATSCTDVMTVRDTGRRTFFYQKGANAFLDETHFDFSRTHARHFHYGYLLLLDRLDRWEAGRPALASVLARARETGLTTSLDCVSESSSRLATWVPPVLPEVDVFFANDYETERILGTALYAKGKMDCRATEKAAEKLAQLGVSGWVVLHSPLACYGYEVASNRGLWQPSVRIDPAAIVNCAGAGDALAAGVLHGWHEGWDIADALALGAATAGLSLLDRTCSLGVQPLPETLAFAQRQGYLPPPA